MKNHKEAQKVYDEFASKTYHNKIKLSDKKVPVLVFVYKMLLNANS